MLPAAVERETGTEALVFRVVAVADVQRPAIQFDRDVAMNGQPSVVAEDQPVASVVRGGFDPGHERHVAGEVQPLRLGDFDQGVGAVELQGAALASLDPRRAAPDTAVMALARGVAGLAALAFVEAPVAHEAPFGLGHAPATTALLRSEEQ